MGTIAIEGMEFYAYHGHFEEESTIGTKFNIDLYFETDTSLAEKSDNLEDTVNYLEVYQCVKKQMEIPSLLIENVARRILNSLMDSFPEIIFSEIKFRKMNPPLGGQMESVSITINAER